MPVLRSHHLILGDIDAVNLRALLHSLTSKEENKNAGVKSSAADVSLLTDRGSPPQSGAAQFLIDVQRRGGRSLRQSVRANGRWRNGTLHPSTLKHTSATQLREFGRAGATSCGAGSPASPGRLARAAQTGRTRLCSPRNSPQNSLLTPELFAH